MHLGFSLTPFGHHPAAWREAPSLERLGFDALLSQVLAAEEADFDFVLLSDRLGARPSDNLSPVATPFEPTTLVAALATRARRIGFLAAASTKQHEPYNLARRFASLDQISKGRTGWLALPAFDDFARDREYLGLVSALWDSWEDDAFIYDKSQGRFFEPGKMHVLNHKGEHFAVRGPLNVNRSPQGKPVMAQVLTQSSDVLAAHAAEVLLLQADSLDSIAEILRDFARTLEAVGRGRKDVRLLANVIPYVSATHTEAQALYDGLQASENEATQPLSGAKLIGTPIEIADTLEAWFKRGHLDGFTILPPTLAAASAFFNDVAPELRRRQLIKPRSGETLRDHLKLSRPAHPAAGLELHREQ
jgi:alkanesulfonate monooxygenase SsuD/methylene tetrahydromethanopterin reductase-like flavin-dependent oxidoreductase (luciferase family)